MFWLAFGCASLCGSGEAVRPSANKRFATAMERYPLTIVCFTDVNYSMNCPPCTIEHRNPAILCRRFAATDIQHLLHAQRDRISQW
jgi:hypothetical protein